MNRFVFVSKCPNAVAPLILIIIKMRREKIEKKEGKGKSKTKQSKTERKRETTNSAGSRTANALSTYLKPNRRGRKALKAIHLKIF